MTIAGMRVKMPAARISMKAIIDTLGRRFRSVHERSILLASQIPYDRLYWKPRKLDRSFEMFSCGEFILRSAASVEQAIGGITTRLWDDPFEWTLPEELFSPEKIIEYLEQVEDTRTKGFAFFVSDDDLLKSIPSPQEIRSLFEILLDSVCRAEHFQGKAVALYRMFSDDKLPRI